MGTVLFNTLDLSLLFTIYQCVLFAFFLILIKKGKKQSNILLALFLSVGLPYLFNNVKLVKKISTGLFVVFLALASLKTISRNRVWKDNLTLSTNDALISVNGAKSNVMAGGLLSEEAAKIGNVQLKNELLDKSIFHLNRAVSIYPEYIDALILMGNVQWERTKNAKNVIPYYQRILSINPNHENTWQNIYIVLEQNEDINYRIEAYKTLSLIHI